MGFSKYPRFTKHSLFSNENRVHAWVLTLGSLLRRLDTLHWSILGGIIGLAATSGGWRSGLFSRASIGGLAVPSYYGLGINNSLSFYGSFASTCTKLRFFRIVLILIGCW